MKKIIISILSLVIFAAASVLIVKTRKDSNLTKVKVADANLTCWTIHKLFLVIKKTRS